VREEPRMGGQQKVIIAGRRTRTEPGRERFELRAEPQRTMARVVGRLATFWLLLLLLFLRARRAENCEGGRDLSAQNHLLGHLHACTGKSKARSSADRSV
jgi:hypothetical protein